MRVQAPPTDQRSAPGQKEPIHIAPVMDEADEDILDQAETASPRTRRGVSGFYVACWGVLGTVAAGYLTMLVMQPDWASPLTTQSLRTEAPLNNGRTPQQLAVEVETLRRTVADLQRELTYVKTAQRQEKEPPFFQRNNAPEQASQAGDTAPPIGSMPGLQATPLPVLPLPERFERQSDRADAADANNGRTRPNVVMLNAKPTVETRPVETVAVTAPPAAPAPAAKAPPPPKAAEVAKAEASKAQPSAKSAAKAIETGSLPPAPKQTITFGPATVSPTPDQENIGLVLDAGPSLDILRLRWTVLSERHPSALNGLQPRYLVGGTRERPSYQLVAGPVSPDEGGRICALLRVRQVPCSVGPNFNGPSL